MAICDVCEDIIRKGQEINWVRGRAVHVKCDEQPTAAEAEVITVQWSTAILPEDESMQRNELLHLEIQQNAPLQRPTCPSCFLELPVSMVCGSCS